MKSIRGIFVIFLMSALVFPSSSRSIRQTNNNDCQDQEKDINGTIIQVCLLENFSGGAFDSYNTSYYKGLLIDSSTIPQLPSLTHEIIKDLQYFSFVYSNMTEISENSFKNLTVLIELDLSSNQISNISENSFKDLQNLYVLTLSSNKIAEIKENTFTPLKELRELYVEGNVIENLSPRLFRNNTKLEVINLNNNQIKNLPATLFYGLSNLTSLELDSNEIKAIPGRIFASNLNLKTFTISQNEIKSIGIENFEIFKDLTDRDFSENPCMKNLARVYGNDDLQKVIENDCKPSCEEKNIWLNEEIDENLTGGKNLVEYRKISESLKDLAKKFELLSKIDEKQKNFNDYFSTHSNTFQGLIEILKNDIGKLKKDTEDFNKIWSNFNGKMNINDNIEGGTTSENQKQNKTDSTSTENPNNHESSTDKKNDRK